ncbi:hypothetical protein [Novosphingobium mangrovi (ex Huang et al. 2023)]|uniref:Sulfur globule protein n=1 Tax=Novosphingobium mangrovi (ex Huang et al. 2023) TaxID=2976432 RepID=A0ABT2I8A0_9SPHN|nr:hypothetical protein [Novosphingobium mangrovi (ex Huang et al. 2023)]MCT2400767.1 hypothetical protein [Novosphingobium mangrovi (ex Huang et al. 2023)]
MIKRIMLCASAGAAIALTPAAAQAGTKAGSSMGHFSASDLGRAAHGSYDEPPGRSEHGNGHGYGTDKPDRGEHYGWTRGNHFGWGNKGNGSGGC